MAEVKRRKPTVGCIRIFRQSIREMGTLDTHGPHVKTESVSTDIKTGPSINNDSSPHHAQGTGTVDSNGPHIKLEEDSKTGPSINTDKSSSHLSQEMAAGDCQQPGSRNGNAIPESEQNSKNNSNMALAGSNPGCSDTEKITDITETSYTPQNDHEPEGCVNVKEPDKDSVMAIKHDNVDYEMRDRKDSSTVQENRQLGSGETINSATRSSHIKSCHSTPEKKAAPRGYHHMPKELTPPRFLNLDIQKKTGESSMALDRNNNVPNHRDHQRGQRSNYSSNQSNRPIHQRHQNRNSQSRNLRHEDEKSRSFNHRRSTSPNWPHNRSLKRDNYLDRLATNDRSKELESTEYLQKKAANGRQKEAEDWSTDLLNTSDWNCDNVMEEQLQKLDEKRTDQLENKTVENTSDIKHVDLDSEHTATRDEEKCNDIETNLVSEPPQWEDIPLNDSHTSDNESDISHVGAVIEIPGIQSNKVNSYKPPDDKVEDVCCMLTHVGFETERNKVDIDKVAIYIPPKVLNDRSDERPQEKSDLEKIVNYRPPDITDEENNDITFYLPPEVSTDKMKDTFNEILIDQNQAVDVTSYKPPEITNEMTKGRIETSVEEVNRTDECSRDANVEASIETEESVGKSSKSNSVSLLDDVNNNVNEALVYEGQKDTKSQSYNENVNEKNENVDDSNTSCDLMHPSNKDTIDQVIEENQLNSIDDVDEKDVILDFKDEILEENDKSSIKDDSMVSSTEMVKDDEIRDKEKENSEGNSKGISDSSLIEPKEHVEHSKSEHLCDEKLYMEGNEDDEVNLTITSQVSSNDKSLVRLGNENNDNIENDISVESDNEKDQLNGSFGEDSGHKETNETSDHSEVQKNSESLVSDKESSISEGIFYQLNARAQDVIETESDLSTHGEMYDQLIREKMRSHQFELMTSSPKPKVKRRSAGSDLDGTLDPPSINKQRKRSNSLPESPFMQIVELVQGFKHKESERNVWLERQKDWQKEFQLDDPSPEHVALGCGRGKRIYDSMSDLEVMKCDADLESNIHSLDKYSSSTLKSENVDTGGDANHPKYLDEAQKQTIVSVEQESLCKPTDDVKPTARTVNLIVPVSHSYMTVNKCSVQQTPVPFVQQNRVKTAISPIKGPGTQSKVQVSPYKNKLQNLEVHSGPVGRGTVASKPFVPKGRGCLSPEFQNNLAEFVSLRKTPVVQDRKGFNIKNYTPEMKSNNENDMIGNTCFVHNDSLAREGGKEPQTLINPSFEDCCGHVNEELDSSSSQPRCEQMSTKSQSTLSGVPTMSDFEASEGSQLDVTRNDIQDDILDEGSVEMELRVKSDKELSQKDSENTGKFEVIDKPAEVDRDYTPETNPDNKANLTNEQNRNYENNYYYPSYFYPEMKPCHCHPTLHQFWVWHACLCQPPRLCEIRTCQDYWMPYPFRGMEGIHQTMPCPEMGDAKRSTSSDQKENVRRGVPPGFKRNVRPLVRHIFPPAPPSRQIWERMHSPPAMMQCRMSYRGPSPTDSDKPSPNHINSPFVCAQEIYSKAFKEKLASIGKSRHKSNIEAGNQNDSGINIETSPGEKGYDEGKTTLKEGSPGFIGPVLPKNIKLPSNQIKESAAESVLCHNKTTPRKRLVEYAYSGTESSEEDRSRSSQAEKRLREASEKVIVVHDSSTEEESLSEKGCNNSRIATVSNSKSVSSKSRQFSDEKELEEGEIEKELEEGEIEDESEDDSKFQDCSSTFSNYQILQTVLNRKFPRNQQPKVIRERECDVLDITDDGSEIISVASQESSDRDTKLTMPESYHPYPCWPNTDTPPMCGYPVMFTPYGYPGYVSSDMMMPAYYGSPSPGPIRYPRPPHDYSPTTSSKKTHGTKSEDEDDKLKCKSTPSPRFLPRQVSPAESGYSETPDKKAEEFVSRELSSPTRGLGSMRGLTARMRFMQNSKLADNDATFKARLEKLNNKKQSDTDSESQSSTSLWKTRFLANTRRYTQPYIDSHCHLDFLFNRSLFAGSWSKYKEKFSDTFPHNFEGCVAVFCHPSSFRSDGIWNDIAKESDVWITFGCHPKNATEFTDRTETNLKMCLLNQKVVALGEIGLDYSGVFVKHKEVQQIVFRKQIQIALEMNLPLVIHCRDAEDDTLQILDEMVPKNYKIHCHCFTGNYESAKRWMDMFPNLFIGLTPLVTYKSATPSHEVARFIPLERLLLETDAPYFVPRKVPKMDLEKQLSHPGMAITVAEEVAWIKRCPIDEVLLSCRQNTKNMYGI